MDGSLTSYLLKYCKANEGDLYTHTTLITPKKKLFIGKKRIDHFWKLYCQAVINHRVVSVTEKPDDLTPVIVDLDFRFNLDNGTKRRYTEEIVKEVIRTYQGVIKDIIDPSSFIVKYIWCCLLEKPSPYAFKNKIKDGFHLHFPYCIASKSTQQVIRQKVIEILAANRVFSSMGCTNEIENIIDAGVPGVTWLLYGGRKDVNLPPYKLTKVYDHNLETIGLKKTFKPMIQEELKQLEKQREEEGESEEDNDDNYSTESIHLHEPFTYDLKAHSIEYYLPKLLSIQGHTQGIKVKAGFTATKAKKGRRKGGIHQIRTKSLEEIMNDLKKAGELMPMLKKERAYDRNQWMEVGWCLFNIGQGVVKALEMWEEFSKLCAEKYEVGRCEEEWGRMKMRGLGMGTLKMWAQVDSPDEYLIWRENQLEPLVYKALSGSNYDVAVVLHRMYENQFACASIKHNSWYEFVDHRWIPLDDGVNLRRKISFELLQEFIKLDYNWTRQQMNAFEESLLQEIEERRKCLSKVKDKLKSTTFKKQVMREAADLFKHRDFEDKLDSNPNLIGFNNGVYDLEMGIFRDGRPEDYISKSTGYDYIEFEENDEEVREVREYLRKVFVDEELRNYFVRFCSSCLRGGNIDKIFQIWSGSGDNAKSITVELLEMAFGSYTIKFPTSVITGKRTQSSSANPEMARMKGARIGFLQEPDDEDSMNIGIVKELTGGDTMFVRALFDNGGDIKPQIKIILTCNKPPKVPSQDKAFWRRTRILSFLSTFCKDPPSSVEEQFKKRIFPVDCYFRQKLPGMAPAFMWILLKEFEEYKKSGIPEPVQVMHATNAYKKMNDTYLQFIDDCVVEDSSSSCTMTEIYQMFKCWYKDAYPGQKMPDKIGMKAELLKRWGHTKRNRWHGYRLILDGDENVMSDNEHDDSSNGENKGANPLLLDDDEPKED